ncbi:hypothetical protein BN6_08960 [Saccharothrix espanaensis DSM 44229]|uniref:Uncharacterized protein n=1 Tax=Saccharothrix espanaensis (strain ATCC 51144 / DSM 44229 / JCM 9112 / NBRC 15066 / NRRL 15764) TaxID=1179773 RepID=K0JP43_SACES|nr:hypothetical protein BN6_08960 [Saccharothrix espanaensis DSM 44229]
MVIGGRRPRLGGVAGGLTWGNKLKESSPDGRAAKDDGQCGGRRVIPVWPGRRQPPLGSEGKRRACLPSLPKRGSLARGPYGDDTTRQVDCALRALVGACVWFG